ncbi:MAG TPA: hypothetical protein ENL05_00370 [Candidatus Moranbacteria bacterium]|nr:hypothetical protein [Candidatus Moranbacteria bacterium]
MKNIWIKHKLAIIILSYALIIGLAIYFLELPLIKNIKNTSNKIQEKLLDQQIYQNRLSQLPQMEKNIKVWQSQKDSLKTILTSDDEAGFIESLDIIAEQTGNMINLQIGDPVDPKELAKIKRANQSRSNLQKGILDSLTYKNYFPMKINLKGSYIELINFIHKLENFNFYVNVISLDIKKEKVAPDQNTSKAKLLSNNVFRGRSQKNTVNSAQKEILNSDIKVIVYTK